MSEICDICKNQPVYGYLAGDFVLLADGRRITRAELCDCLQERIAIQQEGCNLPITVLVKP
jgi:hypothetical protein